MPAFSPDFDICMTCRWVRCAHPIDPPMDHDFAPDYLAERAAMTDHGADTNTQGEPPGGWVTSPTLATAEIVSVVLCKFTGEKPLRNAEQELVCQARTLSHHANVDCLIPFMSANGVAALMDGATAEMDAPVVTMTGDTTFHDPL